MYWYAFLISVRMNVSGAHNTARHYVLLCVGVTV